MRAMDEPEPDLEAIRICTGLQLVEQVALFGIGDRKLPFLTPAGPEGFDVTVTSLDLRAGGQMVYLMTATAPEQVAFMKRAGMPLSIETRITYTEVSPPKRLAYKTLGDFVPDVTPYEVATVVELRATTDGVKLTITFDAMHDDIWTERARAGHESQLRKLDALMLAARKNQVRS